MLFGCFNGLCFIEHSSILIYMVMVFIVTFSITFISYKFFPTRGPFHSTHFISSLLTTLREQSITMESQAGKGPEGGGN